jgi:hypothetical protein
MLNTCLGAWQIAGNTCEATLSVDRPRSINIGLVWTREPGATENEHLSTVLPEIVKSALDAVEQLAEITETILDLIAQGKVCRIGIKEGFFVYAATDRDMPNGTLDAAKQ